MDIHRSRFVPYPPSAINALAFSHPVSVGKRDPPTLRLAIGRANGNIEIWNPSRGSWIHETTFSGGQDRSVEGLAWIQEPGEVGENGDVTPGQLRLFSIGYSSSVTEWDLNTGLPLRHSGGNTSEVWCLAAQPRWQPAADKNKTGKQLSLSDSEFRGQNLVAGCADGTLALLSTADGDLRFQRYLARPTAKKARVLSVTFQTRDIVVAGFADSNIRVFDSRNGSVLRNISLGAAPIGGPREILVWAVKCLPNGNIVSGDSTGEVRIFDGKIYSQLQRITGHEADVLTLATSQDGQTIYSGGMDRRTVIYKANNAGAKQRWAKLVHRRYHEHDVKAMATYEGPKLNFLVSGGLDTTPIVLPMREYGKENSRALPALPQSPPVASATASRLLASWWDREVRLWRVGPKSAENHIPKLAAKMVLRGEENITSAALSEDGSFLVVATVAETKLFQILPRLDDDSAVRIRKLETASLPGARLVRLSPNGKWLSIITPQNEIFLARLVPGDDSRKAQILPRLVALKRLPRKKFGKQDSLNGSWGNYYRTITQAAFSQDSAAFAVGDLAGYIDTWIAEGHEDPTATDVEVVDDGHAGSESEDSDDEDGESGAGNRSLIFFGQHWIRNPSGNLLPKLDSAPRILSFRPTPSSRKALPNGNPAVHPTRQNPHPHSHDLPHREQYLFVLTAQHQLYEFDVPSGLLTDWSRRNPTANLPEPFRTVRDRVMGCIWDVTATKQRVWLYGSNWLFMFDLTRDFPQQGPAVELKDYKALIATPNPKKRKNVIDPQSLRKHTSGAGSRLPDREVLGMGSKMRKITGAKGGQMTWIELNNRTTPPVSDDESDEEHFELPALQRDVADEEDEGSGTDNGDGPTKQARTGKNWWHTFKYRPILGIVPIGQRDLEGADGNEPLEVVLVERPSWELDLPPRYVSSHERER